MQSSTTNDFLTGSQPNFFYKLLFGSKVRPQPLPVSKPMSKPMSLSQQKYTEFNCPQYQRPATSNKFNFPQYQRPVTSNKFSFWGEDQTPTDKVLTQQIIQSQAYVPKRMQKARSKPSVSTVSRSELVLPSKLSSYVASDITDESPNEINPIMRKFQRIRQKINRSKSPHKQKRPQQQQVSQKIMEPEIVVKYLAPRKYCELPKPVQSRFNKICNQTLQQQNILQIKDCLSEVRPFQNHQKMPLNQKYRYAKKTQKPFFNEQKSIQQNHYKKGKLQTKGQLSYQSSVSRQSPSVHYLKQFIQPNPTCKCQVNARSDKSSNFTSPKHQILPSKIKNDLSKSTLVQLQRKNKQLKQSLKKTEIERDLLFKQLVLKDQMQEQSMRPRVSAFQNPASKTRIQKRIQLPVQEEDDSIITKLYKGMQDGEQTYEQQPYKIYALIDDL